MKLALEEWRHWLEGSQQPFLVWTDHKNLEYVKSAQRLNARQARWALFFGRFNFVLSYRPGSHNMKPDALSRQFSVPEDPSSPETILPSSCVVASLTWQIEAQVRKAQHSQPDPCNGPINRLFVPDGVRSQVLQWGRSSKISCHPGVSRTLEVIRSRFWWPTMEADTKEFIKACTICARHKTSNQPSAGLLQPLPIPKRPLSHIAVDCVTGLPASEGNTVILTIVDRFSKAAHFVPLLKLPSAKETATL